MGSQSRRFRASETVDSELGYWYLLLFLCLVGFLSRPVDYGHTYQRVYREDNSIRIDQALDTANPGDNFWEEMESEVVDLANSSASNYMRSREYLAEWGPEYSMLEDSIEYSRAVFFDLSPPCWLNCSGLILEGQSKRRQISDSLAKFRPKKKPCIQYNDRSLDRFELDSSGDLLDNSDDSGGSIGVHYKLPQRRGPVCRLDPEDDLSLDPSDSFRRDMLIGAWGPSVHTNISLSASDSSFRRDRTGYMRRIAVLERPEWFMVSGMEQIELVIDYKIPKGTSTESSLNLPSSATCFDSIPKLLLTLLRDEAIEIMGILKELCHIEECSNVAHYVLGLSPDNDFELRAKVISIILAGIFTLVITLRLAWERIRDVVLFKSDNELDALILEGSDLEESYLADQILYENLLREAELVSEGSSGQVFKVRFLELECAMKVFHSTARMDFRKESITLLNLSHPHVVKFFCSFRKSLIIMELMDEDLYSFITKIRERRIDYEMPLEVALDVMLQIAEGMSYLHRQGIAHQDLKSLNILLKLRGAFDDPDFQIIAKIADFGSARRFNPRYPTSFVLLPNMNIGTRSWRAPELFHPRGSFLTRFFGLNPRVLPKPLDIYGFAVICSELLTKQIPFSNDQDLRVAVLASKLRDGHRPALPSAGSSEGLLALIKDCWHQDPVLRPEFHEVCARLIEVKSSWMSRGQRPES